MNNKLITDIFNMDRVLWHGDKLQQWQMGKNPYPVTMDFHLTGACNLKCPMCSGGERTGYMTRDFAIDILEQLRQGDVRGIVFTGGGEPTLHKKFSEIIHYTKKLGYSVGLITNGSLFTDEKMEAIVACNDWVRISLDAYNNDTYNKQYGMDGKTFEVVCENISKLVEIKKKSGSNCTIGVGYLIDDKSIPGMISTVKKVASYGVDYIQFRHFETYSSTSTQLSVLEVKDIVRFDYPKFAKNLKECLALETSDFKVMYHKDKFEGIIDVSRKSPGYSKCHGSQFTGAITATGDVYICCVLTGDTNFAFGNLKEETFFNIWNGERRNEITNNLDISHDCVPFCRNDRVNKLLEPLNSKIQHVDFM